MIYYSNVDSTVPHMVFIGRWSPFHKGHAAIIIKKLCEHPNLPILILVRNTKQDQYSPTMRAHYIKTWMVEQHIKGTIMIIPNVEGVYWGRGVGYKTGIVEIGEETEKISGTAIRSQIQRGIKEWRATVAVEKSSYLLSTKITSIIKRGLVIWFTGCPSSGKTTLATNLVKTIHKRYPHLRTQMLDGDEMRSNPLAQYVGFTKKDRADHIRRMAFLAKMFANHGIIVVCAFVSPDRAVRDEVKQIIGGRRYFEVYVRAALKARAHRDAKGLYRKAVRGEILNLTGFNAPYEPPLHPAVVCDTDKMTMPICVESILKAFLTDHEAAARIDKKPTRV